MALLVKDLKIANRIIIILGIGILGTLFLLLWSIGVLQQTVAFDKPVTDEEAVNQMDKFRDDIDIRKKTRLVYYEAETIRNYMNNIFKPWEDNVQLPAGKKWVVGFYPMRRSDHKGHKNRVDFLVIPTVFEERISGSNRDTIIYDFYDKSVRDEYYPKRFRQLLKGDCPECVAYDAGHLWP